MKYLVIGDPHLTHKSLDKMKELCEFVEANNMTTIWLGDMLDTKEVIRGKCLDFWYDYFSSSKLTHYILVGNHDLYNLHSKDHSLNTLKGIENVIIVDKLYRIMTNPVINLIPYTHDQDELLQNVSLMNEGSYLFGHLELTGFDFGNGRVCDHGTDPKSFSKFKKVISGHFHKYQSVGNLTYLGTPFSHSFGESNQDKYLGVFDSDSGDFSLIKSILPSHRTIEIPVDSDSTTAKISKQVDKVIENDKDYYRIILNGYADDIKKIKVKDLKSKFSDVKFISKVIPIETTTVMINENASNMAQFKTWASSVKNLDAETTELGLELLKEVIK